jgi:hypothetical protein
MNLEWAVCIDTSFFIFSKIKHLGIFQSLANGKEHLQWNQKIQIKDDLLMSF